MDTIFSYVCEHAHHAPWILFCLLLLSGFSLPISEDLILIGGGALASTCIPDHTVRLYLWLLFGCYGSAWIAYWIGRFFGPHILEISYLKSVITKNRVKQLNRYFSKFGLLTFIVGRFCPGGIRNALFMTSGMTKMPFYLLVLRDGLAALLSSSILFSIGYHFGKHFDTIKYYFHEYTHWFFIIFIFFIMVTLFFLWYNHRSNYNAY